VIFDQPRASDSTQSAITKVTRLRRPVQYLYYEDQISATPASAVRDRPWGLYVDAAVSVK